MRAGTAPREWIPQMASPSSEYEKEGERCLCFSGALQGHLIMLSGTVRLVGRFSKNTSTGHGCCWFDKIKRPCDVCWTVSKLDFIVISPFHSSPYRPGRCLFFTPSIKDGMFTHRCFMFATGHNRHLCWSKCPMSWQSRTGWWGVGRGGVSRFHNVCICATHYQGKWKINSWQQLTVDSNNNHLNNREAGRQRTQSVPSWQWQ